MKIVERCADARTPVGDLELANRVLVLPGALFDNGDRLTNDAVRLEESHQHQRIGEIADIERCRDAGAEYAVLRHNQYRQDAALIQIGEQLVQLHQYRRLVLHRAEISVQAVDQHEPSTVALNPRANRRRKLAGCDLRRIELLD